MCWLINHTSKDGQRQPHYNLSSLWKVFPDVGEAEAQVDNHGLGLVSSMYENHGRICLLGDQGAVPSGDEDHQGLIRVMDFL